MNRVFKRIVEALTKRHFLNLLNRTYSQKDSNEHLTIQKWAQIWYGLKKSGIIRRKWAGLFISFINQAQVELFHKGHELNLGESVIGFSDIQISCHSTDANSGVVYLYGFSDNLTYFDLYRQYAGAGTTAIDVGANLGIHTAVISQCVGEQGQVVAYEPVERIFQRLKNNVQMNGLVNVSCIHMGIGDTHGTIGFDDQEGDFNIGKARIQTSAQTTIPLTTIDTEAPKYPSRVSLIKIDVEGFERHVLRGAINTLQQHQPVVVCEFNPESYPFQELVELIPFKADYYQIPNSYWETLELIDPSFYSRASDVLIIAKE